MRFSTSTNIYSFDQGEPYAIPMDESFRACAKAGFQYVDANLCGITRPGHDVSVLCRNDWETIIRGYRKTADQLHIQIAQSHAWWCIKSPIDADGLPEGEFGEEMMQRSILASEILGVKWMVVHPFSVAVNGERSPQRSFDYNLAYFRKWNEEFKKHHVGMAVENMVGVHGNEWGDVDFLIKLVDAIGDPNVGTCLDTGHANVSGHNAAECARKMGKRLHATHINDNYARGMDEHLAPFCGTVDWPALLAALKDIGYKDDFSYEIHNYTRMYPKELQPELIRFTYSLGKWMLRGYDCEG